MHVLHIDQHARKAALENSASSMRGVFCTPCNQALDRQYRLHVMKHIQQTNKYEQWNNYCCGTAANKALIG